MAIGSGLSHLEGYPFEVRYSAGSLIRARSAADVTAGAYDYLRGLLSGVEPDIAVIVADEGDWESRQPYGLPFFNDDQGQIRPGILVMPAGSGDFWIAMGRTFASRRRTVTRDYGRPTLVPVASICSPSSTWSRSTNSATHSKSWAISGCRPSG
jgi:hypothetical protein